MATLPPPLPRPSPDQLLSSLCPGSSVTAVPIMVNLALPPAQPCSYHGPIPPPPLIAPASSRRSCVDEGRVLMDRFHHAPPGFAIHAPPTVMPAPISALVKAWPIDTVPCFDPLTNHVGLKLFNLYFVLMIIMDGIESSFVLATELVLEEDDAKNSDGLDLLKPKQDFVLKQACHVLGFFVPMVVLQWPWWCNFNVDGTFTLVRMWHLCGHSGWFWYRDGFNQGCERGSLPQLGSGMGNSDYSEMPALLV